MNDHDTALREVAALVAAVLRKGPPALEAEIRPVAERLGDGAAEGAERLLREALGLKSRDCVISGGDLLPFTCPVHGVPCDECGGLESCEDWCGADPAGTVTNLRDQAPKTVWRDGACLVIPALRLDAEGCGLLRRIINREMPALASARADVTEDGMARAASAEGTYRVEGKDGFDPEADYYPIGEHPAYGEALEAARELLGELNRSQPGAGGQDGIQDRVYVVHPDGHRERVLS